MYSESVDLRLTRIWTSVSTTEKKEVGNPTLSGCSGLRFFPFPNHTPYSMYSRLRTAYVRPNSPSIGFDIGSLFVSFALFLLLDIPQVGYSLRLGHPLLFLPRFQPTAYPYYGSNMIDSSTGSRLLQRCISSVPYSSGIYRVRRISNRLDVICVTCMSHILHTSPDN